MQHYLKPLFFVAIISALFPVSCYLYFQVFLAVLLLGMLLWGVVTQRINIRELLTPYTLLMVILLGWSLFSFVWAVDREGWLISNVILISAVVHAITLTYLFVDKIFKEQLMFLLLGIITAHHLIGWFEWLTSQEYLAHGGFTFHPYRQLYNPMLFFGNINDYALFLLFSILFCLSWQPNLTSPQLKWLIYLGKIALVLSGFLLIHYVAARGILFSAGYALVFFGVLHISSKKLRRSIVILGGISCLIATALLYTDVIEYLSQDGSFVIRYHLIRNGWLHLKQTFYMGVGAGNTDNYMINFNYYPTYGFVTMHNWWMGMLVSYGLPFFVVYGLYHIRVFVTAYYWAVKYHNSMGKFVVTWLFSFIVAGMIPNTLFHFIWFWMIHHLVFVWFENEIQ